MCILDTHDIQSITISSSNGTVCIQCNYITGADSTGCIVSLSNTDTVLVHNITIHSGNEYGCGEVIAGFYSTYVFEINNDGTIVEVENIIVPDIITVESSILSTTSYFTNSMSPTMPSKLI